MVDDVAAATQWIMNFEAEVRFKWHFENFPTNGDLITSIIWHSEHRKWSVTAINILVACQKQSWRICRPSLSDPAVVTLSDTRCCSTLSLAGFRFKIYTRGAIATHSNVTYSMACAFGDKCNYVRACDANTPANKTCTRLAATITRPIWRRQKWVELIC